MRVKRAAITTDDGLLAILLAERSLSYYLLLPFWLLYCDLKLAYADTGASQTPQQHRVAAARPLRMLPS